MPDDPPSGTETSAPRHTDAANGFGCAVRRNNRDGAWIELNGELDIASAPQLAQTVDEVLAGCRLVVLDLRELTFMDSTGLSVILAAQHRAQQLRHRLMLVRGPAQVERLLELTGTAEYFEITDLAPIRPYAGGLVEHPPATNVTSDAEG